MWYQLYKSPANAKMSMQKRCRPPAIGNTSHYPIRYPDR